MVSIGTAKSANPLSGFTVDRGTISFVGHHLQRPDCILAERDGTLWVADARGAVMRIAPDGSQTLVLQDAGTRSGRADFDLERDAYASLVSGTLPNGLAFARDGDILVANFGTDRLEVMDRTGRSRVLVDSIDGRPLGKVNFVLRDSRDRIWLTIATRVNPWTDAVRRDLRDGYVCVMDERGLRIVADGFQFTGEIRLDAAEEWLYVAETMAKRVVRLRVRSDGSLGEREVFGPESLGAGFVSGICFDVFGNLWATMISADRLIAITPEGEVLELLDDGDHEATALLEAAYAADAPVPFGTAMRAAGTLAPWLSSVTFGGPDLRTVYLGSLLGTTIPSFRSPVAGLPMVHW